MVRRRRRRSRSKFRDCWSGISTRATRFTISASPAGTIAPERFAQGSVAFRSTISSPPDAIPEPDHVKIDVDGHENKVVRGMRGLLERRAMRTVLIEADPIAAGTRGITERMWEMGGS